MRDSSMHSEARPSLTKRNRPARPRAVHSFEQVARRLAAAQIVRNVAGAKLRGEDDGQNLQYVKTDQ